MEYRWIELELYLFGKIETKQSIEKKSEIGAIKGLARCAKEKKKKKKMDARKIPRNLRIHICISEIYRAPAASALKYGRFIWFSSYVGHKFPLNLEFRSRAHQPTLSPRRSPPPRPSLGPGPDISNGCKTKSRRPYLYPLPLFLSSPLQPYTVRYWPDDDDDDDFLPAYISGY